MASLIYLVVIPVIVLILIGFLFWYFKKGWRFARSEWQKYNPDPVFRREYWGCVAYCVMCFYLWPIMAREARKHPASPEEAEQPRRRVL